MSPPARLLLVDPYVGGHHADHLEWLGNAWRSRDLAGDLVIAAAPDLFARHPDLYALAGEGGRGRVRLHLLPDAVPFESPMSLAESAWRHVGLIGRLLNQVPSERLFAMYLDHAQFALALRRRRGGPRCSGLLFRPEAHLPPPASGSEKVRRFRKAALLRAMMSSPSTEAVFTLDPTAVEALRALSGRANVHAVPDPAPVEHAEGADIDNARTRYAVGPDRSLWVLPGALGERKGVLALAAALPHLGVETQRRISILFAGEAVEGEESAVESAVENIRSSTEVHIVWDRRFMPTDELQATIARSDVVLAPYVDHVGSSGIVMRAAAAGLPIVTQSNGLIGQQARHHRLGRVVDPTDPEAFARILNQTVDDPMGDFDAHQALAFASSHTVEAYADAILGPLGLLSLSTVAIS